VTVLLVLLGGAVGAPVRYVLERLVQQRVRGPFPCGTLTVNVVGSAVLGALLGAGVPHEVAALVGTGFCGALTTFSAFGYETVRLLEDGSLLEAGLNAAGGLALGLPAAAVAYTVAAAV
jgi:fluoride exporter